MTTSLTAQKLKQIAPFASASALEIYPALLNEILPKYEINTRSRIAAFLSQVLHESGSLRYVREIASGAAYEGRKDLGNIHPGDGVKFKGRGLIQVTGRANYRACSLALFKDLRLEKTPDVLATPRYAVESACWFWDKTDLNAIADHPEDWKDEKGRNKMQAITRRVNGGYTHLEQRVDFYNRARIVLK